MSGVNEGDKAMFQVGGRLARWELYHDLHRVEHAARRGPSSRALGAASANPAHAGWHVLNGHLPWLLPPLLQLMRCLNAVWEPQVCGPCFGACLARVIGDPQSSG